MSNMSYCRFENALADLKDCYDELSENGLDVLSDRERKYAVALLKTCAAIASDFEDEALKTREVDP
jgi:hypothetical protein